MKVFIDKQTTKNVFFVRDIDLAMIKSKSIPFKDLRNLLYYNVAREDLLSWISYQRAMEKKVFGRKITRYLLEGELRFKGMKPKHDMALLTPLLEEIYQEVKYYEDARFYSYALGQDTVVILSKNDTLLENGFKAGLSSLSKTLFSSILTEVGYYKFYFNEPVSNTDQDGVGLPELISKILS